MAFAGGTGIATPEGTSAIETLERGSVVLAAPGSAPPLRWTPAVVEFSGGVPPGTPHPEIFFVVFNEQRRLICTRDQVFMRPDGTLALATDLIPGEKLLDQNGTDVPIAEVIVGEYVGALYQIATSLKIEPIIDGHLIIADGIVAGDLVLQQAYAQIDPSKRAPTPEQRAK